MFKVKIDPKQLTTLQVNVNRQFQDLLAEPKLMEEIGDFARDRIVYQARTRKPLTTDGRFPELSPQWVKRRGELEQFNQTADTYSQRRSNLTFTGQLLDSYDYEVSGLGEITLGFKGTHAPYKTKSGNAGKPVLNETIAQGLKEMGYAVVDRSVETNKTIIERIKSIATRYLRRTLRSKVAVR